MNAVAAADEEDPGDEGKEDMIEFVLGSGIMVEVDREGEEEEDESLV